MSISIGGIQEAQLANLQVIAALKPSGAFGRAIQYATVMAQRYSVVNTHVDTGALKASHRIDIENGGLRGIVYLDPGAINPKGQRPSQYGVYEHARGGDHAFYEKTVRDSGEQIGSIAGMILLQGMP